MNSLTNQLKADSRTTEVFDKIVAQLLGTPGVSYPPAEPGPARGFGSKALKVNGKIFAMVDSRGRFVVKLPHPRVVELMTDGRGASFEMGNARWMKEWVCLVPGTEDQWADLAREALEFVGSLE